MARYLSGGRKVAAVVMLAVAAAMCWAAWMGWDIRYDIDPAGQASGPYQPWQVVGCVLCLAAVTSSAGRWLPTAEVAWTVTFAFTVAFSTSALLLADHDPLVVIGIFLVFFATFAGSAVVATAAGVCWTWWHERIRHGVS